MMEGTMAQTTHKRDEDGRMVQVVTPWELRRVLDEEGSCYSRPGDFGLEDEWRVGGVEDEPAAEPEVEPIEIADCGYDCGAGDTQWRYGLYLDPEARRIGHWEMYGSGTPERVWHGRAVIADLPFGAVGESVEEIVRSDELRDLVAALFALYEGSEWNGSNHIGRWQRDDDEYCDAKHELTERIEKLFEHVATYWSASEWLSQVWSQSEADSIRARMQDGETLEEIAEDMVSDARINDAHIGQRDMESTLEELLEQYPVRCSCSDCGGCDEPATTTDDAGNDVCDECSVYMALRTGENVCSRATDDFTVCHECGETIDWSGVLTGPPDHRLGDCKCGKSAWRNDENGGSWDRHSYGSRS
jgi:hypothetical protein